MNTLLLAAGDGGSEYDPNNIAQDDNQLSGKLLKIDLGKLNLKVETVEDFNELNPDLDCYEKTTN